MSPALRVSLGTQKHVCSTFRDCRLSHSLFSSSAQWSTRSEKQKNVKRKVRWYTGEKESEIDREPTFIALENICGVFSQSIRVFIYIIP